mmetsp:Transcript_1794/g.5097  ORF Transcript_1794/g.5097 Transcript_1794/m.5097 type:complete len:371 (-) Transcript_1794:2-1114(-)
MPSLQPPLLHCARLGFRRCALAGCALAAMTYAALQDAGTSLLSIPLLRSLVGRRHPPVLLVALLELAGQEEAALVEEGERDDGLGDANALAAEDPRQSVGAHVRAELSDGLEDGDRLALDGIRLHDHLEARERVRHDDVDRRDDRGGHQVGRRAAQLRQVRLHLLLDVLLQLGLADQTQHRAGERVAHERDCTTEEGHEVLLRRLTQDFHERLLGAGLLEEGALLLLDHAHRVDEGRRADRRHERSVVAGRLGATDVCVAEEQAKLGHALKEHANQTRPEAGERGGDGRFQEDSVRLGTCLRRRHQVAVHVLGVLLHELAVGSDRIVAHGLDGGATEVGAHVLERREAILPHLVVRVVEKERHGSGCGVF